MLNLVANGPSGYNLTNSLRFRSSASAYLNRTPASAGNRQIWTWSGWVKRGQISIANNGIFSAGTSFGVNNNNLETISFPAGDTLEIASEIGGATQYRLITTQVFRDPSAWYHVIVSVDTTQATASNRIKIYINGTQVTAFGTSTYPAQNYNCWTNSTNAHRIGSRTAPDFDGYMDEINFIDGQALTPSSFGSTNSTTGVWQPAKYTGTYGTNGFYLNFSNIALTSGSNTGLGKDYSGNGNYWNTNNISVTSGTTYDAMTDVPTLTSATVANYGTWNPLNAFNTTTTDGNLGFSMSANNTQSIQGTFGMTSGKWYFEYSFTSAGVVSLIGGIVGSAYSASGTRPYQTSTGYMYISSGNKINSGSGSAYGSTYTTNDIIGVAVDLDNGKIWFSKNGTWQASGDPAAGTNPAYTGLSGSYVASVTNGNDGVTYAGWINCGQRPFSYTAPTGFLPLNTYNLPTPTILQGNKYMDATLWTGTGTALNVVNAGQFKPDFVWVKSRSNAYGNRLADSVRGVGKELFSNETSSETTNDSAGYVSAFNSNGFSFPSGGVGVNANAGTYVGWQWQAGQGTTSSNTSGSITSTVSVNTTAGFSIATFTSPASGSFTFGHGLGVAPKMVITKIRNAVDGWQVWHTAIGGTQYLQLNTTAAVATNANIYSAAPTSTVVNMGSNPTPSYNIVAYCWAEIAGFSKFGSYTGNGSSDGPFVYTGFRPKFVLIKYSSGVENWAIWDTSRNTYNVMDTILRPDSTAADTSASTQNIDFVSNGFKIRGTDGKLNTSSGTYIYAAFAENPFKVSNAR